MAATAEIDSFYFKFKYLLLCGQDANLNIEAEDGKASVQLSVEVDVSANLSSRNSPPRHRRRERRAVTPAVAENAVALVVAEEANNSVEEQAEKASNDDEINVRENKAEEAISSYKDAIEDPAVVVVKEPLGENNPTDQAVKDKILVKIISVIPMTIFNLSDIEIQ